MQLDQISLLTAIGFSSAALTLTLLVTWLCARADVYLLNWAAGMAAIVLGVVMFSMLGTYHDPTVQLMSFILLMGGCAMIYAGGQQFHTGRACLPWVLGVWGGFTVLTSISYAIGLSGIGTVLANFGIAALLLLAAYEYWVGRAEAPLPLIANAVLYGLVAASFVICGIVLLANQQFVLTTRPSNWAEDLNSIITIIALTGIGAVSVTLNQLRAARHHRREAMTDPLTGMLNRRALFEDLGSKPLEPGAAVIMFDIDHFKAINDRQGHAMGDRVLQRFAQIIQANLRAADSSARLGGEEFCIVLGHASSRSAAVIAERIRAAFEGAALESAMGPVTATVSAGLAFAGCETETFEQLLGRADDALYKAKSAGRNRIYASGLRLVA